MAEAFGTPEGLSLYQVSWQMSSVRQRAFPCTKRHGGSVRYARGPSPVPSAMADAFGTPEGLFLYPIAGNGECPPKVGFAWTK
ncbi:MAG TPA: hypothetical protein DDX40_07165 [Rikenellaceae bacterium]|nr:hypothetical protein [Rikenellaceae bacterium]